MACIRGGGGSAIGAVHSTNTNHKKISKNTTTTETKIVTNKPRITPNKPMKTLHWKRKIVNEEQKSNSDASLVWDHVDELKLFDKTEFEDLFCVKKTVKKASNNSKKTSAKTVKKEAKTSCLPKMRAQHLGILLSSLPSLDLLQGHIMSVNNEALNTDKLEMILNKFPSNEEIMSIKQFEINY
eukprot:362763_1